MSKFIKSLKDIFGIQSVGGGLYLLNDPSTPELSEPQVLPPRPPHLEFTVNGFNANELNSINVKTAQTVNCYITMCKALNYFQTIIAQIDKYVAHWSATRNLQILPYAGKTFNAFYDRRSLQFFYDTDPLTGKLVYSVASNDIVTHELGHSILDILRPDLWNVQSLEAWAFHEAFGDVNAIAYALQHDRIIERILIETNGSLMTSNTSTRLAEEMGSAIFRISPEKRRNGYLRDVSIIFNYVNPQKLPQRAPDDQLCAEAHSFGRVFAGAWYEIFVKIFEAERGRMGDIPAVKHARDVAYSRLIKAVKITPNSLNFTEAVARCMITVEKMKNGAYSEIMKEVFENRQIIKPIIKMLSDTKLSDVLEKLDKNDAVSKKEDIVLIRKPKKKSFKISDYLITDLSTANNPLYTAETEVPGDTYYLFENNVLVDEVYPEDHEILQSSIICALVVNNYDGLGEDKMWKIEDNKLIRNHIVCKGSEQLAINLRKSRKT